MTAGEFEYRAQYKSILSQYSLLSTYIKLLLLNVLISLSLSNYIRKPLPSAGVDWLSTASEKRRGIIGFSGP